MKKWICLMLAVLLMLSLVACGTAENSEPAQTAATGLQVGFGRQKIMPDGNVTLGGSGTFDRVSEGYLDILYTTCIAISDETGNTVLLITNDLVNSQDSYAVPAKEKISQETGIPVENIMMAGTHTHAAPSMKNPAAPYQIVVINGCVQAAKDALADRAPAQISAGSVEAEGLAYSRHYVMLDGSIKKTPGVKADVVSHADDPYDTVQLVKFDRGNEKKPVIMMTFGIHPTFNGQATMKMISADFPSPTRDYIEAETGALVAYFTSAAGNQGGDSQVAALRHSMDYKAFGKALGKVVVDALPGLTACESGTITLKQQNYAGTTNKDKIDQLAEANRVQDEYVKNGEKFLAPMLQEYGFDSVWEANAIIDRAKLGDTLDVPLNALAIGELSMIFAPYEMFGPTAEYINANTPYGMTMVVTCANGSLGYLPTEQAYDYKVYEGFVTKFVPGTAEALADTFLDMLRELKG